ncbi:DUF4347 domain-containing protein, partial [Polynucleobacter sp. AP-Capit-er-40B-B4]|uniref:DUF4347 domain-containing protein n=1 Tax=Polynucleobacter sp. AP-Capit-er-40B-B4 TaxID=2576927 RepID=UPI001C0E3D48
MSKRTTGNKSIQAKKQYKSASKPRLIALEPRMLFDGAAVATAIDATKDAQNALTDKATASPEANTATPNTVAKVTDTPIAIDKNQIEAVASLSGLVDGALALAQPAGDRNELIVIDGSLENLQSLLANISRIAPDKALLVLDPTQNEVEQLTSFLQQHNADYDAIHILSHGGPGWISLKDQVLSLDALDQNAALWNSVKTSLNEAGDLLLYGCNVTNDSNGQAEINALATFTGADIAASTDVTGSDGNWVLETTSGAVDAKALVASDWQSDLGVTSVTSITVNEASPYAVFTVVASQGQTMTMALTAGTATGAGTDYGSATASLNLQYSLDGGATWVSYSASFAATLTGTGLTTGLLVRTPINNDVTPENGETFTLSVTPTSGTAVVGTATIKDDGTGTIFTAAGGVDSAAAKNNDITVTSPTLNEGSPYAFFTVKAVQSQNMTLALTGITATDSGTDFGSATTTNLQYSLDGGTTWVSYTGAFNATTTGTGTTAGMLVRTPITNDTVVDNGETFTLTVTPTGGVAVVGTATVNDDGTGALYTGTVTSGAPVVATAPTITNNMVAAASASSLPNDDRPLSVNGFSVTESGAYAVFTVTGGAGQYTKLSLGGTATSGTDYTAAFEFFNATAATPAWQAYTAGNFVLIPITGTLLVRVAITNDVISDNGETITLTATNTGTVATIGTATIMDDGTGLPFNGALTINTFTVNEGSPYAVFTVGGKEGQYVSLVLAAGTATANSDYTNSLEYWNGAAWVAYPAGGYAQIPSDGDATQAESANLLVRVAINNDALLEAVAGETFTLTARSMAATPTTGTGSVGTATIMDDGTGTMFATGVSGVNGVSLATTSSPATAVIDVTSIPNDDRVKVSNVTVNETGLYAAFSVTSPNTQAVFLSTVLGSGTGFASSTDIGAGLEYWDTASAAWVAYTAGSSISMTAGQTLSVRIAIINEVTPVTEGAETFTLQARTLTGAAGGALLGSGTATIVEDGTGSTFATITPIVLNECSSYAVFTIDQVFGKQVTLSLVSTTYVASATTENATIGATDDGANDINNTLQYWNGGVWVNYVDGSTITTPTNTTLLVRVAVYDQEVYEGPEAFTLKVADASGNAIGYGVATIMDNGTGSLFTGDATVTDASAAYALAVTAAEKQAALELWRQATIDKSNAIVAGNQGAFIKADNGAYYVSGANASPTGANQATPLLVNAANGYNYTGTIIDVAVSGRSTDQYLLLTTTGLYVWGAEDIGIPTALTTNTSFQRITTPADFILADVKSMTTSYLGTMFLMKDGTVRSVTTDSQYPSGHPATGDFTKVVDTTGNALTGITNLELSAGSSFKTAAFAYSASSGKFYTWGTTTYLGNGTASTSRTQATEMANPLPVGVSVVQIGASYGTYFVLGSDGKVYVCGLNASGSAGQNNTTALTSWTTMRDTTGAVGTSLTSVQFINAQNSAENNNGGDAIALILKDSTALAVGSGGLRNKLGTTATGNITKPTVVAGSIAGKQVYTIDVGGYFSAAMTYGTSDVVSYSGEPAGSVGTSTTVATFTSTSITGIADAPIATTTLANPTPSQLCDDTGITINNVTVSETSPVVVFVIDIATTQTIKMNLVAGTATAGTDFTATMEYWTGSAWLAYTANAALTVTAGTKLNVRVPIKTDAVVDPNETFFLNIADIEGSVMKTGTATIAEGSGLMFTAGTTVPVTVSSLAVNEGSSYAVFTIAGAATQVITSLTLAAGTVDPATGAGIDYGTASGTGLEYWSGSAWTSYASGSLTIDGTGKLLVRTRIINDSFVDNNETLTLTAVNTASGNAMGTVTIVDDGTGIVFVDASPSAGVPATLAAPTGVVLAANVASLRNDDRILSVSGVTVNEASPYAILSVIGVTGQYVKLSLTDGTATVGVDTSSALQYYDGSAWQTYVTNSYVPIPANSTTLLVRIAITNDLLVEGSETFNLLATNSDGSAATGIATIKDDATGNVFSITNTTGTPDALGSQTDLPISLDDDRVLTVNNLSVNEASTYAVFTLTGKIGQALSSLALVDGSTTPAQGSGIDYGAATGSGLEYWNGTAWTTYTSGTVNLDSSGTLLVRTAIINDATADNGETFTLTAISSSANQTATGTATIKDDASGTLFTSGNPTGNTPATATPVITGMVLAANASTLLNDDRTLSVTSPTVNEGSPYAIFEVTGVTGQYTSLSLASVTATVGTDTGSTLEYYNGTAWVAYTAGSFVQIPNGDFLLVRVEIKNDTGASVGENGETFKLLAQNTNGTFNSIGGIATIMDDGSGSLFSISNISGVADAPGTNGAPATLDRDFGITSVVVNEGSPYAVFSVVGGKSGSNTTYNYDGLFSISITAGTASSLDYGTSFQYWNGSAWAAVYGNMSIASKTLLRVAITNDMLNEGTETFTVNISSGNGATAAGTITIKDDGTGTLFTAGNPANGIPETATIPTPVNGVVASANAASLPDDDRPVTVNSFTVNEGSPYAVFTVTGISGQLVKLATSNGTASSADYGSSLQYFDGSTWQTYNTGDFIQIASAGKLLVRTTIINDTIWDPSETFNLIATTTGNVSATGVATINDDGSGSLFSASNTMGIAETAGTNGLPATLDSDRIQPLTINNIIVNEASPYAVFNLTGTADQVLSSLTLDGGSTNPASSADYGSTLESWNGTAWVAYANGTTKFDSNGKLLVRLAIVNDVLADNGETFTLTVTDPRGAATGTATIKDDGSGALFTSANPTGLTPATAIPPTPVSGVVLAANATNLLNDDRALSINNLTVNEGSPYAVFTVTGVTGQYVKLASAIGTASSADFGSTSLQYFYGTTWQTYTAGSYVQIPAGASGTGTTLLVRTTIANDAFADDGETFTLTATNTGTIAVIGTATIKDDGTGDLFSSANVTGAADAPGTNGAPIARDNDQTLTVNSVSVNEDSPYVVFIVTGVANQPVTNLSLVATTNVSSNATLGTDLSTTLEYNRGAGWVTYSGGTVNAGSNGQLLVRAAIINDDLLENAETFKLVATALGGNTSAGTGTILDNAQGGLFSINNTTGVADAIGSQSDLPVALDNDLVVGVTISNIVVNECSPYATFVVDSGYGLDVKLSLVATTYAAGGPIGNATIGATDSGSNDLNSTLQYWSGSAWVNYTSGSVITIPTTADLLVRVALYDQSTYEGPEAFTLNVTDPNGKLRGSATATIMDDGTGTIYTGDVTPVDASAVFANATTAAEKQAALDAWRQTDFDKSRYIISGFHGAFYKSADGGYYVAGENASATGGNVTIPILVNAANGFNYTGTIIDVAVPSTRYDQFVMLTTDGLYAWGTPGVGLSSSYNASYAFQKIATPTEFVAADVKSMTASYTGVLFLMKDGTVRTVTMASADSGHPSTGDFTKVVDANGAVITGITDIEYFQNTAFAYSASTGQFYTWGARTYLGDGSGVSTRITATLMASPLPAGVKAVQIGMSDVTYFVLGSDGHVYVCGSNPAGAAGQGSIGAVPTWTTMRDTTGAAGTSLGNVQFFSAQNSAIYPSYGTSAINMILKDGSVLAAGADSRSMLGISTASTNYYLLIPTAPAGSIVGQAAFTVETGGHFSSVLLFGCSGVISATGHNPGGAFADGTTTDRTQYVQTQFLGNLAEACVEPITLTNPSLTQLCDDRPLAVNSLTVNEGSPYAVFTVTGAAGQYVKLSTANGTASSSDYGSTLQYFDGTAWQTYVPGSYVQIPNTGTTLLVRVAITNDGFSDNSETFNLLASNTDGTTATGVGTIKDDGTGSLFSTSNTIGTPETPSTNGLPSVLDNDQGVVQSLSVNSLVINEGSPYAVFTVSGAANQAIASLALAATTNPSLNATLGSDTGTALQYWNGSAWVAYTGAAVNLDSSGNLLVRVAITNDASADNNETFNLVATNTGGVAAIGLGTILDDGTGTQFTAANPTGLIPATLTPPTPVNGVVGSTDAVNLPNDDRPLAVNNLVINEGSPYAVFTVTGTTGQYVSLALAATTNPSLNATLGADTATALQYFNGTAWVDYTPGSFVQIPSGSNALLVRVAITNDASADNNETFNLVATNTGGVAAIGLGTILDDGTGTQFTSTNPTGITPATLTPPTPVNGVVGSTDAVNLPND